MEYATSNYQNNDNNYEVSKNKTFFSVFSPVLCFTFMT